MSFTTTAAAVVSGSSTSEVDELIEQWTNDRQAVRNRTLEVIRRGHAVVAPLVVVGMLLARPGAAMILGGSAYCVAMIVTLTLVPARAQAAALAVNDLLFMSLVSATDTTVWLTMVAPTAAAITVGWLISARATWMLWVVGSLGMAAAGFIAQPPGWNVVLPTMVLSTAGLNFNNLKILGLGRDSVLRVADLVESLPVIVWEADPETFELTRAVGRVEELLGFAPAEWRGLAVADRVHPDDLERYVEVGDRLDGAELDEGVVREVRLRGAKGSTLRVREVLRSVQVGDHNFLRGVILDINEEAAARDDLDRLGAVIANQSEALMVLDGRATVDAEPIIRQVNPAFARLADCPAELLVGARLDEGVPWLAPVLRAGLDHHVLDPQRGDSEDVEISSPTGAGTFDYTLLHLPDGKVAVQFTDVTERRRATELIRHQAFHDPLTSLPNRTLLFDRLTQALAAMRRNNTHVGLLLLDLDQFKEINDTLGHGYGDELLAEIAHRLSDMMREVDTVARLGGDEFAVVLAEASETELAEVARRVATTIKAPIQLGGIQVEVSCSVGGVVAPIHGADAHILLQRADIAMYDAKRSGSGYRLYTRDDDRHSLDRLTLMGELRHLLDDGLRVWYQPKVDLRTGQANEMEALARWQHDRLGLIGPGQFIELCEVSGLVGDLTFAVLDESLKTIADWPGQRVAVNVPVRNLYDRHLPAAIADRLDHYGVSPDRLILEITEREIMEDHRVINEVLEELHDRGVRIAIDDFGTGFSSLTHLRKLPVHEIKIDQSFVAGMLDHENDYIIARSIIDLAHNLGHRVVAEGVEDEATLALLRSLGCDAAQGFLFARPGPASRVRARIEAGPALDADGLFAWSTSD